MKSVFDVLNIIGSQLKEFLGLHLKLGPLHRRQEDWRKHNHCRLVGGRFNKQGTYICVCDRIRSLHLPTRILKSALTEFSHINRPDGLNSMLLSEGCVLGTAPGAGMVGKILWKRKWQPTPVFLPGNSWVKGTWWAIVHVVARRNWYDLATK